MNLSMAGLNEIHFQILALATGAILSTSAAAVLLVRASRRANLTERSRLVSYVVGAALLCAGLLLGGLAWLKYRWYENYWFPRSPWVWRAPCDGESADGWAGRQLDQGMTGAETGRQTFRCLTAIAPEVVRGGQDQLFSASPWVVRSEALPGQRAGQRATREEPDLACVNPEPDLVRNNL